MVAPLAGSVDRNITTTTTVGAQTASLPSRGAWIEMSILPIALHPRMVAPLTGNVDRNHDG